LTNNDIDKIVFVNSEDYDGMTRNEKLYKKLQEIGAEIDIREYKQRTTRCNNPECGKKIESKVQAEVDIAVAIKLINFARMPNVESITLVAGDRDFIDSI